MKLKTQEIISNFHLPFYPAGFFPYYISDIVITQAVIFLHDYHSPMLRVKPVKCPNYIFFRKPCRKIPDSFTTRKAVKTDMIKYPEKPG